MSKSYGNVIEIFAPADLLRKQIFSIKTDSKGVSECKDPKTCLPFILYSLIAEKEEAQNLASALSEGKIGYADVKTHLFEKLLKYFGLAREKRLELEGKPDFVEDVLAEGAKKAKKLARTTLEEARKKTGLI